MTLVLLGIATAASMAAIAAADAIGAANRAALMQKGARVGRHCDIGHGSRARRSEGTAQAPGTCQDLACFIG